MKTAVVDVGGGLRGVYATGVLDRCLEEGIRFDAGSAYPPAAPISRPIWPGRKAAIISFMRNTPAAGNT